MDNYEWNHGTTPKLGLCAVDPLDAKKTALLARKRSLPIVRREQ